MFTNETLNHILAELAIDVSRQFWVAYSGGLDSHVLLHALCALRKIYPHLLIKAIHVNHGISNHAMTWSEHCVAVCKDLDVTCVLKTVNVSAALGKSSLEAVARDLRYDVFRELIQQGDYLLMAHHRDDLAETFLLQALRGAGVKGLSGMPFAKLFFKGVLVRPLLNISRQSLFHYAQTENLVWVEDESNISERFDRNYLRHHILSPLLKRFPGANTALCRSARHCAEADKLLDELAQHDLQQITGNVVGTLCVDLLLTLTATRQRNVLRFWIRQHGFLLPSTVKLEQLCRDLLLARPDACPYLTWSGAEVRRYGNALYIMPPLTQYNFYQELVWDMSNPLNLPGIGVLTVCEKMGEGLDLPDHAHLTVRFRRGGERMHPLGRLGSHPLKKLFQEWRVPPWLRASIPLIYYHDTLVMVVGYALSEHYVASGNRRGKVVLVE